jgi:SAM-dependent methyltransferase
MAKELCRRRNLRHKVSFVLGDAERLPFFSEHFDTVFFKDLLHHVPNPLVVTNEMARVCKTQGDVIGIEANRLNPEMFLVALFFRNERRMLTSTSGRTLQLFAVSDAYGDLSVKNEAVFFPFHTIGRVFTPVIPRRILLRFLEIVDRLENVLGRSPLLAISLFFVVSARKKASTISQDFSLIKKM